MSGLPVSAQNIKIRVRRIARWCVSGRVRKSPPSPYILSKCLNKGGESIEEGKSNSVYEIRSKEKGKAYDTGSSQAVPHPSTIPARRCLTSVIGRERVFSSWYGRRHQGEFLEPI